jgi:hypothetical protein
MSQLIARFRLWQDAIDTFWQDWVLAYDLGRQLTLAGSAEAASRGAREFAASTMIAFQSLGARRVTAAASFSLAAILLLILVRRLWKRRRKPLRVLASPDEASRIYARVLRSLATRGYAKPSWQTSSEFADAVSGFPGMQWLREFTAAYHAARYGGGAEALERLRGLASLSLSAPRR